MKYLRILYFDRRLLNLLNLIIKPLLNKIDLLLLDLLSQDIDHLHLIVIQVTIHHSLHRPQHVTALVGHAVAELDLSF